MTLSHDAIFEEIDLTNLNLPFCTGCSTCFRKGHEFYPHNVIIQNVINKIDEADGIHWSEPTRAKNVYNMAIPVPFHKKLWGTLFYILGKQMSKHITITYNRKNL